MKNKDVDFLFTQLNELIQTDIVLPCSVISTIISNLQILQDAGKKYFEYKSELIQKYGENLGGGNYGISESSENADKFTTDIAKEADDEVDVHLETFDKNILGNVNMPANIYCLLSLLFSNN